MIRDPKRVMSVLSPRCVSLAVCRSWTSPTCSCVGWQSAIGERWQAHAAETSASEAHGTSHTKQPRLVSEGRSRQAP